MTSSGATSSDKAGAGAGPALDATAIELATGLSLDDLEALGTAPSPQLRAEIAVRFARHLERLARGSISKLANELMVIFSKDRDRLVRMRFAEGVKANPGLPPAIAARLARDEIAVAAPILERSPALDEAVIRDIIKSKPEAYALVIADRRPLSEPLVEALVADKGTSRIAARLLDNHQADLSDEILLHFHEWGQQDPNIAERLRRRPNLPFAFVDQGVAELAEQIRWPSLGDRAMSKFEATQLQSRFEGKTGHRCMSRGERHDRLHRALRQRFERGELKPATLLAFLRDRDIDRVECGFAVMTGVDLRRVRRLLHGGDRRGLIALCLKAKFGTADYLAFRIALGLAALGDVRDQPRQRYPEKTMRFARDQFERMRADPAQLDAWLPSDKAWSTG